MKKPFKVLATATILAMAAIPAAAFAQNAQAPLISNGNNEAIVNQVKVVPGTMGKITNFVNDNTGKFITVTGRSLAPTDQSEIILSITKDTKIVDAKGNKVALQKIIDDQKVVKAFYNPNITKSLPARGNALTLVVQNRDFSAIKGTVSEVREDGSLFVKGTDLYGGHQDEIVLHLDSKASILDQNHKAIEAGDIKKGMSIEAFYGPAVAMSLPAQSTTNYVVVNTEEIADLSPGTSGIITNINDKTGSITVIGNAMEQGGTNYLVLHVDQDTEIVDENGAALTADALKENAYIDAFYGNIMTMSYPAQTHAKKIVVKASEAVKAEGTISTSERAADGQVYLNVGSDDKTENDIILNITDKTVILPALGGDSELKDGMKVVVYHSPIMTRSLPGITNAEVVIVSGDSGSVAAE